LFADRRRTHQRAGNGATGNGTGPNGNVDALVGALVGDQYLVRKALARGSESVAYLAEQPAMGRRQVVVKVLDELFWRLVKRENRREANPYLKEIRVATMLRHPAFAHLHAAGALPDGRPWMAMEYVEGQTLGEHLRQGPLPLPVVAAVTAELLSALRALHAANVVHRDLKPDHVILQPVAEDEVRPRILDLGHAQSTYQTDLATRLGSGEPIGTPGYLSPELAEGRPADERSDLFTVALLVYEMLAGVPAIHIEDGRPENLVAYVRSEAPLPTHPLRSVRPECPEELERTLARALDRRSRSRFETALALRDALLPQLEVLAAGARANGSGSGMFGRLKRAFGGR
jgi:serine/threonine-protein kinase